MDNTPIRPSTAHSLLDTAGGQTFGTLLADPPWRFRNRSGKVAPEHKRLMRYATMDVAEIAALPVAGIAAATAHLYLWVPNALLAEGLHVMAAWGFAYMTKPVWQNLREDGEPDGRVGGRRSFPAGVSPQACAGGPARRGRSREPAPCRTAAAPDNRR